MAPEQAWGRSEAVTTATDVYGLGAVLYGLLTGSPPFRGDSVVDTLDRVRSEPPEPPSHPDRRAVRDLETICLKCLEKEPERRYPSALAVAGDLERWLRGEPIAARPVGRLERGWRWCRRNPIVAGLTSLIFGLLLAGSIVLFYGNRMLAAQRDKARDHSERAEKALAEARLQRQREAYNFSRTLERVAFVARSLHEPKAGESPELLAQRLEIAEQVVDVVRIFLEDRGNDPTMRIESVYAHRVLGSIYETFRTPAESRAEFGRAIEICEQLVADYPDESAYFVELGHIHEILAHHDEDDGLKDDADREFRNAETYYVRAAELDSRNANALNFVAWYLANSAPPRFRKPDQAIFWGKRALAVARDQERGRIWGTLGMAYYRNGDWRLAVEAEKKACQVRSDGGDDHDFFTLAMAHWRLGHTAEANQHYDKAIRWMKRRGQKPEWAVLYAEASALLGRRN
jgi:tetratricopeptide (TPR) repeat protein